MKTSFLYQQFNNEEDAMLEQSTVNLLQEVIFLKKVHLLSCPRLFISSIFMIAVLLLIKYALLKQKSRLCKL